MLYEMRTERSEKMDSDNMKVLNGIRLAPYIQLSTELIKKHRKAGGNMFRHQMETLAILIDYGYIDSILLKASVIHDCVEDLPDFDQNLVRKCDSEGEEVLKLVLEVSKQENETKDAFLKRIIEKGSHRAKILKTADRISNMMSLGFVTEAKFIEKTCNDTEAFVLPIALLVDFNMYQELISLLKSRQGYLEQIGYYNSNNNRG